MIPEAKHDAVSRALRDTFGVGECDDFRQLTAGLSAALVFRIVVRGCPYLLRVIMNTGGALGPGQGDPTRQFACIREAAGAGLAPHVWYTNSEDGISITDFVEARPLSRTEALVRLPATIRTVHALPAFPKTVNYLDFVDGFVRRFRTAGILPNGAAEQLCEGYARVAGVYPRDGSEMVSSHNDLKPENILFDGDRVWLVDWEAAFLNDRYLDLAVVANFVVTSEAEEVAYLSAYFGEAAGGYRAARFYLMSQILHAAYAAMFLRLGSEGRPVDLGVKALDFREFHERIWAGEVGLAGTKARLEYGMVHLEQFLRNVSGVRFKGALRTVGTRSAPHC